VRVSSPVAAAGSATIDAVRVRDGAGATRSLSATFTPAANPADLDGDGSVGSSDLGVLLSAWGACSGCAADIDADGDVGSSDLGILLSNWS
jgi:hypothetical protein